TRIPAGIVFTIEVLGFTAAIVKLAIWFYFLYVFEFRFKLSSEYLYISNNCILMSNKIKTI
ncbi:hypothetical protein, partial [Flavobacterium sp. ZS1P14]|uniref:hypothetical protein n=1 Tax=Flavobacterium sp. ZS1P14 TaxID=3401729 RepID=UPI003AADAA3C